MYCLMVLCYYVLCCLLQSHQYLIVPHIVPSVCSVCSVSLCPLQFSTLSPLSVSTSLCTVCLFCVTMSTAVFYSLSTLRQYVTLKCLLFLCHFVYCCFLLSVHLLAVPHIFLPVGPFNMTTAIYILPHAYQYLIPYGFFSLSLYQRVSSRVSPLSVSTSHCACVVSEALWPLTSSTVSPLSDKSSHCIVCWLWVTMSTGVFYSLSTVC